MRITGLALLVAATQLSAATILPASWIEVYDYDSGAFSIQADDGFFITGHMHPGTTVVGDPDPFGMVNPHLVATGLDVSVASVSSPWVPGPGFGLEGDGVSLEVFGAEFPMTDLSAPFTFFGFLAGGGDVGNPNPDYYEFSGQGTLYLTILSGPGNDYVETARYEFETVATVPEPSTWGLVLLGLVAAWRGGRRLGRGFSRSREYAPAKKRSTS